MDEFLKAIADILEVDELNETDDLKSLSQCDSLSVLTIIAMLDAHYGVNLETSDFETVSNVRELWQLVRSKQTRASL